MGPLIMTGLAAMAAAPAIGWISAATSRAADPPVRGVPSGRSLAIISIAFCEGIAILGVVAGLLAVFMDGPVSAIDEALAAALPISGAALGLVLIVRNRATTDPRVAIQATGFILGLGVLGPVVAYLAMIIADNRVNEGNALYPILGIAQLLAIIGIALSSAGSIKSIRGANIVAAKVIASQLVLRSARFEFVGVGSFVIAVWLLVSGTASTGALT